MCTVDAQHFLASRKQYPELDKQVAMADRIVVTKSDLADPGPVIAFLKELNPDAELVDSTPADRVRALGTGKNTCRRIASLGPIRSREHFSGIRAFSFRPPAPVSWAGWSAWSRLVKRRSSAQRLIRVKGLLQIEDTGEIVFVQGVQGVFHAPQRFKDWPDDDHGNRLVCIARDLEKDELEATLPALNTPRRARRPAIQCRNFSERQARR